ELGIQRYSKSSTIQEGFYYVVQALSPVMTGVDLLFPVKHLASGDAIFLPILLNVCGSSVGFTGERNASYSGPLDLTLSEAKQCLANNNPWNLEYFRNSASKDSLRDFEYAAICSQSLVMLNRPTEALWYLDQIVSVDIICEARTLYDRAMIWSRHLAPQHRDTDYALSLLERALRLTIKGSSVDEVIESALLKNGLALIVARSDLRGALALESEAIASLSSLNSMHRSSLSSTLATLYSNKARIHSRLGEFNEAMSLCNKAIDLDSQTDAHYNIAVEICLENERNDWATQYLNAMPGGYHTSDHAILRGNLASVSGDATNAISWYEAALELNPELVDVRLQLAQEFSESLEIDSARECLLQLSSEYLDSGQRCRRDLLHLELDSYQWDVQLEETMVRELERLRCTYPESSLIAENIEILKAKRVALSNRSNPEASI
ncbi:MAG: hypothetical protein L0G99_03435, partial [Propionibacteriales bacterium]|nr:hypothetical protein [Propionibacteriales bacterium]